jgi:hypothetical protein
MSTIRFLKKEQIEQGRKDGQLSENAARMHLEKVIHSAEF